MIRMKHAILPVALTLVLALTGCGQSAGSDTADAEATPEETAEVAEETAIEETTIVIPDELTGEADSIRSFDPTTIDEEVPSADTYATADNAADLSFDQNDAVEEGTDDQSKTPSGYVPLYNGGMQVDIPSDWEIAWEGAGNYSFLSADHKAYGFITAWKKESGHTYDVVEMVSYLPKSLIEDGYSSIEVIDIDTIYSTNGTLCDAYIILKASKGGTDYIRYYEFLESKSYVTGLAMASTIEGWAANFDALETIACSVTFAPGEGI